MEHDTRSDYLLHEANYEERSAWGGFCEIESEPALFNALLRDFGVQGVHMREIISLDKESLSSLPTPIYGVVLLFKWYYDEAGEHQEQSCPEDIWFANQTTNNACASVALLNIVNNIPNVELGENLLAFRNFTQTFKPADKGDAVANFEFVRKTHNSFARKVDIQNADLSLSNEVSAHRKCSSKSRKESVETGFHFVAFMPIHGRLWKLDGLERQPLCLGDLHDDDWLQRTKPDLEARMLQCQEDELGFVLLSLVRDPLIAIATKLIDNISALHAIENRLERSRPGWRAELIDDGGEDHISSVEQLMGQISEYVLRQSMLDCCAEIAYSEIDNVESLLSTRRELINDQASFRMDLREHKQIADQAEGQVAARKHDHGARVQGFARFVEEKMKQKNSFR